MRCANCYFDIRTTYKKFIISLRVINNKIYLQHCYNSSGYSFEKKMIRFFNRSFGLRYITAFLLLFVFTLGITPRITLHNWFANHKDSTAKIPSGKTTQFSKAGFNCKCDDLVAESHFATFSSVLVVNSHSVNSSFPLHIPSLVSLSLFHNNLRGPPYKI